MNKTNNFRIALPNHYIAKYDPKELTGIILFCFRFLNNLSCSFEQEEAEPLGFVEYNEITMKCEYVENLRLFYLAMCKKCQIQKFARFRKINNVRFKKHYKLEAKPYKYSLNLTHRQTGRREIIDLPLFCYCNMANKTDTT